MKQVKALSIPGIGRVFTSNETAKQAAASLDGVIENHIKMPEELKEYEVWMEGYAATGEYQPAMFLGRFPGRSFKDACHRMQCITFLQQRADADRTGDYYDPDRWDYESDGEHPSIWSCRLFDNEADARKAFG